MAAETVEPSWVWAYARASSYLRATANDVRLRLHRLGEINWPTELQLPTNLRNSVQTIPVSRSNLWPAELINRSKVLDRALPAVFRLQSALVDVGVPGQQKPEQWCAVHPYSTLSLCEVGVGVHYGSWCRVIGVWLLAGVFDCWVVACSVLGDAWLALDKI